ncbi:PKD domain-containing protein [Pedobacter rhodius]|uniref:PKD domain-containing protein n=1 Tax=Pedobacter rhodius TaxID=3004098 RepID=A0ABT4L1G5_9SPHI|nr:PKD domain-containing protein [Pedobacter sp. SJ11]MCZ4225024.1 PKD domain-containing protein [Pedobacter sp. SJ11]
MKTKNLLPGLAIALICLVACKKQPYRIPEISTTEFRVENKSIYLTQAVVLAAQDSTGADNYIWNYGDGSVEVKGSKAEHRYKKSGVFEISLTVAGNTSKTKIRVFPGDISYQIKNNSSFEMNLDSYVNLPQNTVKSILKPNAISDTIFVKLQVTGNLLHVTNISGITKGKAFRFDDMFWQKDSRHNILTVDNKSKIQLGIHGETGISSTLEKL